MRPLPLLRRPHHGRVLVVDHDTRACAALRLIVEYDGHEVRETAAPDEALELLDRFRPHVVLLDPAVQAPEASEGSAAVARRARSTHAAVILTSPPNERFDRRALRWITARVSRPFDFVELRLLVSREVARFPAV